MKKNALGKVPHHFPGITLLVPKQGENEIVPDGTGAIPDNIPKHTDNPPFTWIRYIANIVLYDKSDIDHVRPVMTFDPPIEIRVGYNSDDVKKSNDDFNQLKLAYWDGSQWVIISDPGNDFEYQILPPSTGQLAEARIKSWAGDPPLAWGK